jgi:hypothetical protein
MRDTREAIEEREASLAQCMAERDRYRARIEQPQRGELVAADELLAALPDGVTRGHVRAALAKLDHERRQDGPSQIGRDSR